MDQEIVEKKEIEKKSVMIPIDEVGSLDFSNQLELSSAAQMLIKLKMAPEQLRKEGIEAVMSAMLLCKQFNLPVKAMNEMAFIKGKLTCYGSLVTTLAERHPDYGDKEEFFLDEQQKRICSENNNLNAPVWAAVVKVKRKSSNIWNEFYFTLDEARQADLLGNSTWTKYRKEMLAHKARSRAFRATYASTLNGVNYHEDLIEALEEPKDVSPKSSTLNEKLI